MEHSSAAKQARRRNELVELHAVVVTTVKRLLADRPRPTLLGRPAAKLPTQTAE